MILVCGIPSESPIRLLTDELKIIKADFLLWNPRNFGETHISYTLSESGKLSGVLKYEGRQHPLEKITAVYSRMTDWTTLPEIERDADNKALKAQCERVHYLLQYFIDNCAALVVNPSDAMMSNNSKPFQLFLAKENGIHVPETLITTNAKKAENFFEKHHRKIIYKSISGTRSIVQQLKEEELGKLEKLFYCPTQFQKYITGRNLRVHVIDDQVIATNITADATDYRYAHRNGGEYAQLEHTELPAADQRKCTRFSRNIGLFFSGLDFRKDDNGEFYCFEANPMPGYSYYEEHTSQPIAYTLACKLKAHDLSVKKAQSSRRKQ